METATKRNRILSPSIRIGIRSDLTRGKRQGLLQEWGWAAELSTRRNWDNQNLMNNTIVAFARPLNQSLFLLSGFYWFLGCKNYFIISISFLLCLAKSAFNFTLANICRDNSRVPPEIIICVDKSLIETASSSVWTWQFFLNTNRLAKWLFLIHPLTHHLDKIQSISEENITMSRNIYSRQTLIMLISEMITKCSHRRSAVLINNSPTYYYSFNTGRLTDWLRLIRCTEIALHRIIITTHR